MDAVITLEPWCREASQEHRLRELEAEIAKSQGDPEEWKRIQESGILEEAWVLSERLGTLPLMDLQQAEYADEKTGLERRFPYREWRKDVGKYHGDPEGEWVELETLPSSFTEILRELRNKTLTEEGEFFDRVRRVQYTTTVGLTEIRIQMEGLDDRGKSILWYWAHGLDPEV